MSIVWTDKPKTWLVDFNNGTTELSQNVSITTSNILHFYYWFDVPYSVKVYLILKLTGQLAPSLSLYIKPYRTKYWKLVLKTRIEGDCLDELQDNCIILVKDWFQSCIDSLD